MNAIEIDAQGNVCVSGELSFTTVPNLEPRGCAYIKQNLHLVIDLAKVTFSDNAGVALLVAWARCAKRGNKKLTFINLPKQLLDLIVASGLKDILPVAI